MDSDIYVAREGFTCTAGGAQYQVRAGATVRQGHPLLDDGRQDSLFVLLAPDYEFQPKAEPGKHVKKTAAPSVKLNVGGDS